MNLKTTALTILFVLLMNLVTPAFSSADDLVCFPQDSAVSLLTDITYCKEQLPKNKQKIELLEQSNKLQEAEIGQLKEKTDLLIQDKNVLEKSTEGYKELYLKTAQERDKAKASAPNRSTWFTAGAITSAIIFIAGFFVIKK